MNNKFESLRALLSKDHISNGSTNTLTRFGKRQLSKKHSGFIVSLEVMLSIVIFTQFMNFTMYIMRVMNAERYISTILTSTASQAARWGGNYTKAFKENTGNGTRTIQQIAQQQLNEQAPGFNAIVRVTPDTIDKRNNEVSVNITYRYPSPWNFQQKIQSVESGEHDFSTGITDGSVRSKSIKMPSVMKDGKLL